LLTTKSIIIIISFSVSMCMVLLFIQIINNYPSSFINNCWLGLDSIIKYQSEIEDKVIVGAEKGLFI
jgi:acetyltransferase-like isoleucine patch superfamily enzyme